jgi:hypothetical protein
MVGMIGMAGVRGTVTQQHVEKSARAPISSTTKSNQAMMLDFPMQMMKLLVLPRADVVIIDLCVSVSLRPLLREWLHPSLLE